MKHVLLPRRLFDKALHAVEDTLSEAEALVGDNDRLVRTYTTLRDQSILIAGADLDHIAIRVSDDDCYIIREAIEVSRDRNEDLTQEEYQGVLAAFTYREDDLEPDPLGDWQNKARDAARLVEVIEIVARWLATRR